LIFHQKLKAQTGLVFGQIAVSGESKVQPTAYVTTI
jgi:hypothetical protein